MMGGPKISGQSRGVWRRFHHWLKAPRDGGFTVIEVLIVLAVTGLLFATAAFLISGRQARTAFEQSIREMQSQIQKTINEVAIGYYPDFGTINCIASPSGPSLTATAGASQGINSGCISMGKAMQFRVANSSPETFKVYSIAGLRLTTTGEEVSTRAAAFPTVVAPSTANPNVPDVSETIALQSGMTTLNMLWGAGAGTNTGVVVFSTTLAQYSGGSLVSGSQRVDATPVDNTTLNMTPQAAAQAINTSFATSTSNPSQGIRLCFVSGGSNQSGLITIGSLGRELSVTLSMRSNTTCA